MIETNRFKDQLYLAAVIALLLLMSLVNGFVAVVAAAALFAIGLILYPQMRRAGVTAGLVAVAVAVIIGALRGLI